MKRCYLKKAGIIILSFTVMLLSVMIPNNNKCSAATTDDTNNGNWSLQNVVLHNTSECELMVRTGNIDNFGYGWNFQQANGSGKHVTYTPYTVDPFSGNKTPVHGYPWTPPSDASIGTDRIMVVSSFNYQNHTGNVDGYTNTSLESVKDAKGNVIEVVKDQNKVRPILMSYANNLKANNVTVVNNAEIQMFVDDFQPGQARDLPTGNVKYQVTINGVRVQGLETIINNLDQSGPVGELITYDFQPSELPLIASGNCNIKIDDPGTNSTADGYAIDFVKLKINKKGNSTNTATVTGKVYDNTDPNKTGISNAKVVSSDGNTVYTDSKGFYSIGVQAGSPVLTGSCNGYNSSSINVKFAVAGTTVANQDIGLDENALQAKYTVNRSIASLTISSGVEDKITCTVTPQDIPTTSAIATIKGTSLTVSNVFVSEVLPDGLVSVEYSTNITPTISGGTMVCATLPDIKYTLNSAGTAYSAAPFDFYYTVKSTKAGSYSLDNAYFKYQDLDNNNKTCNFNTLNLTASGYDVSIPVFSTDKDTSKALFKSYNVSISYPGSSVNHKLYKVVDKTTVIGSVGTSLQTLYNEGWQDYNGPILINQENQVVYAVGIVTDDPKDNIVASQIGYLDCSDIDTEAPTITLSDPIKNNDGTWTVNIKSMSDNKDHNPKAVDGCDTHKFTAKGENFVFKAVDGAGNVGEQSYNLTDDVTFER